MRWLFDVTVDMRDFDPKIDRQWRGRNFNPLEFHACFMAAAEAASRWHSLALLSLPPGEYKDLQIMHPLQHLESFKLAASCHLGNFLEPLLNTITTTVTPRLTVMEAFHPDCNKTDPIFELYTFFRSFCIPYRLSLCYHMTVRLMSGSLNSHHAPRHMTKSSLT